MQAWATARVSPPYRAHREELIARAQRAYMSATALEVSFLGHHKFGDLGSDPKPRTAGIGRFGAGPSVRRISEHLA